MRFAELLDDLSNSYTTDAGLAQALGVSKSTVSRWIQGRSLPKVQQCVRIADLTGLPPLRVLGIVYGIDDEDEEAIARAANSPASAEIIAMIERDPALLPDTKQHLINQYRLLLRIRDEDQDGSGPD